MASTELTLGLGILTILGSGLTSAWVNHKLNRNHGQTLFLREKAEALYLATDEFERNFSGTILIVMSFANGHGSYNDMLDQIMEKNIELTRGGPETMTMLVEIYFPTARNALNEVWKSRAIFNELQNRLKAFWREEGDMTIDDWSTPVREAGLDIIEKINNLKSEIIKAARIQSGVKQ